MKQKPGLGFSHAMLGRLALFFIGGLARGIVLCVCTLICALVSGKAVSAEAKAPPPVHLIRIEGAISPATSDFVARVALRAEERGAQCLIIELDTPGGLFDSTKAIIRTFYASQVPIVVYVTPAGANAGSAGCLITLAADVAAMAPNTSIGAAHPVGLGGMGGEKSDDVMTKKMENFAASYIEAIAERRHRNAAWAVLAVRESASVTAEKALELKVIDVIAKDLPELLGWLDGKEVNGRAFHTTKAGIEEVGMNLQERLFQTLWRPEVLFVLMLVAIYGIIGELSNPGAILPGVAGSIALILALYMGSVLPVNGAGLALLLLAVGLFITDIFAPTHGVLTAGGVISFFLGSLLLFSDAGTAFRLSLGLVVPATIVTGFFFVFVIGAGLRAQRLPKRTGRETFVGREVSALTDIDENTGWVLVDGESWTARSPIPIEAGSIVEVVGMNGLVLQVSPKSAEIP